MKIAFVSLMAGSPWAASEVLWAAAARRALATGHEVLISAFDWRPLPEPLLELQRMGARLDLRPPSRWRRRSAPLTYLQGTFRTLRQFNPDVLCLNQGGTYDIARGGSYAVLRRILERLDAPYLLLCHCEQPAPPARNLEAARRIFGRAAIVGMVADRLRSLSERHLGMTLANTRVFHNPVNLQRIEHLLWPQADGTVRFAFVGRLDPVKNLEALVTALGSEAWRTRDWTLTVYGSGPDRTLLERQVQQLSLQDRIRFAGFVNDIAAIWSVHHVLVMPSRFEGVPLAMIEAMLCGRPVVATDVGGIAEWLQDGCNGFLIGSPDPPAINAALERLWNRREQMEQLGRQAHQKTMEKRDSDPAGTLLDWILQAARHPLRSGPGRLPHAPAMTGRAVLPSTGAARHPPPIAPVRDPGERPMISVVIPTYEPQPLLIDTLRSVLSQDPGPRVMQIAIVDDGSTAVRPSELLGDIAPAGRIEMHEHDENLGLAGNWNRAIAVARGKYVHILHQDDTVCDGFYAQLLAGLEHSPQAGMAFSRHAFIDEQGRVERISHRERRHAGILPGWLERISEAQRIQCPAAIVRREAYETLGGFRTDLCYALDWEMWARIAARYAVWYEPGTLASYRRHERTETARLEAVGRTTADTMVAIEMMAANLPPRLQAGMKRRAYRRLVRTHLRRAAKLLEAGHKPLAIKQIDSARTLLTRLPGNLPTRLSQAKLAHLARLAVVDVQDSSAEAPRDRAAPHESS